MAIEKILVIEADSNIRRNMELQLRHRRYEVFAAATLAEARRPLDAEGFDLAFVDVRLLEGAGTDLLKSIQKGAHEPLLVITTESNRLDTAVECIKGGAFDYLIKPFSSEHVAVTMQKAEEFIQLLRLNRFLTQENEESGNEILGRSAAMEQLRQLITKVARTRAPVLIQGESGTGKDLVARAIHRESTVANGPFIRVNCADIPDTLAESEFFGHEKGAFSGALTKREGRFELANGGTIFLDEISAIPSTVQAKLLRVIQEGQLERVGGNRRVKIDVRVLATTNQNLEHTAERKEALQQFIAGLNAVNVSVPALRERLDDIPFLAEVCIRRFSRKYDTRTVGLSNEALIALNQHLWPGNVRELQNVIERAVILAKGNASLEARHLGLTASPVTAPLPVRSAIPTNVAGPLPTLAELEKTHIFHALEHCHGNRTQAARMLDISIRTLRNKLHEYRAADGGLTIPTRAVNP